MFSIAEREGDTGLFSLAFPSVYLFAGAHVAFPLLAKERDATRQIPWERGGYFWGVAVLCGTSCLCPVVLSAVTDPRCSRYCMAD